MGILRPHPPRCASQTGKLRLSMPQATQQDCALLRTPEFKVLGPCAWSSSRVSPSVEQVPHLKGAPSNSELCSHSSPTFPHTHLPAPMGSLLPDLLTCFLFCFVLCFFLRRIQRFRFSVKFLDSNMLVIKTMFLKSSMSPRKASHLQI